MQTQIIVETRNQAFNSGYIAGYNACMEDFKRFQELEVKKEEEKDRTKTYYRRQKFNLFVVSILVFLLCTIGGSMIMGFFLGSLFLPFIIHPRLNKMHLLYDADF